MLLLICLILAPLGAGFSAIVVAPPARLTDIGLDGLSAQIDLRIGDNTVQVDSGLLGGLRKAGPTVLGKPIGLEIKPNDLDLALFQSNGSLDPATIDVAGHLFADPQARQAEIDKVTAAVVRHYGAIGFGAMYLVAMLEIFGYVYVKYRRRTLAAVTPEVRAQLWADRRLERGVATTVAVLALVAVLVPAGYGLSPLSNRDVSIRPDAELNRTFLSGWQLTGPFKSLFTQAVNSVDSLSKSEQAFYDKVAANRDQEYLAHYGADTLEKNPDVVRLMVLDDLQGTSGMARTVAESAQRVSADAIVNLGDLTATGTQQEAYLSYLKSYTVEVLARYAGDIPVYSSLGRHDTPAVAAYAKKVHITVADGGKQKIAGAELVGANSPYIVNFGEAAQLLDPDVTTDTVAAKLRDTACADKPLAVFTHDKELLDPVTTSGCVPIVIGGHDYTGMPSQNVTTPDGITRKIILGSTGGHGDGDGLGGLSTPRNNAPFVLLSIDKKTGSVTVDTTTVHPDASVTMQTTTLAPLAAGDLSRLS